MPEKKENYETLLLDLQDASKYPEVILDLRRSHSLHDFFEWRLESLIRKVVPVGGGLHVQREKHGISNGRIDLAAYDQGRSVLHFELIASSKNGHVFRDSTSLLASLADEKTAILIDEDIDSSVSRDFVRAIPDQRIPRFWLRTFMLQELEDQAVDEIQKSLDSASFRSGDPSPSSFRLKLSKYVGKPGDTVSVKLENIPAPERVIVQINSEGAALPVFADLATAKELEGEFEIPFDPSLVLGPVRVEAFTDNGERSACTFVVNVSPPKPKLTVVPDSCRNGDSIKIFASDFPPRSEVSITFWGGNCGIGIQKLNIDKNGFGTGKFTVPTILNGKLIELGAHRISARIPGKDIVAFVEISEIVKPKEIQFRHIVGTNSEFLKVTSHGLIIYDTGFRVKFEFQTANEDVEIQTPPSCLVSRLIDGKFEMLTMLTPASESLGSTFLTISKDSVKSIKLPFGILDYKAERPKLEGESFKLDFLISYSIKQGFHLSLNLSLTMNLDEMGVILGC